MFPTFPDPSSSFYYMYGNLEGQDSFFLKNGTTWTAMSIWGPLPVEKVRWMGKCVGTRGWTVIEAQQSRSHCDFSTGESSSWSWDPLETGRRWIYESRGQNSTTVPSLQEQHMLWILYRLNHSIGFDEFHFWTATILPRRVTTLSIDSHQLCSNGV